jgi:DNA-binding GntR family transcriptional regulator
MEQIERRGLSGSGIRPDPADFAPLHTSGLADRIAEELYGAIVDGRLRSGERLSEAAIARQMGVSRGPIREAERQLERKGLLVFVPRRGFFVRRMTGEEIRDLFGVRIALERFAVAEAIRRADDGGMARLRAWQTDTPNQGDDGGRGTASDLVERDLALHRLICELSGSASLNRLFDTILTEVRLALSIININFGTAARVAQSHAPLIEAILARDEATAVAEIEAHLARSRDILWRKLEQLEQRFDDQSESVR